MVSAAGDSAAEEVLAEEAAALGAAVPPVRGNVSDVVWLIYTEMRRYAK